MTEVRSDLSAEDLWEVEKYFREQGVSEFIYDEPLDVLRFPEDGRFACVRSLQIGNGCRSVATFTSEVLCHPAKTPMSAPPSPLLEIDFSGRLERVDKVLDNLGAAEFKLMRS